MTTLSVHAPLDIGVCALRLISFVALVLLQINNQSVVFQLEGFLFLAETSSKRAHRHKQQIPHACRKSHGANCNNRHYLIHDILLYPNRHIFYIVTLRLCRKTETYATKAIMLTDKSAETANTIYVTLSGNEVDITLYQCNPTKHTIVLPRKANNYTNVIQIQQRNKQ